MNNNIDYFFQQLKKPKATRLELNKYLGYESRLDSLMSKRDHWSSAESEEYYKIANVQLDIIRQYDWDDISFEVDGKQGMKDFLGNVILEPVWDCVLMRLDYFAHKQCPFAVKKDGKWGLVSADGNNTVICEPQYDDLTFTLEGRNMYSDKIQEFFFIDKNGKDGLLLPNGEELIPCIMDRICYKFQTIAIYNEGKVGFIATNLDHTVVNPEYDEIDFGSKNILMMPARKGKLWGRINSSSGEFEADYIEEEPESIEYIEVLGLTLGVCLVGNAKPDSEKRVKFRFNQSWFPFLRLKDNGPDFFTYMDDLINAKVKTSLSEELIPIKGNILPSSRDLAYEKDFPVNSPLYHDSLEAWLFYDKVNEFYHQAFDRTDVQSTEDRHEHMEFFPRKDVIEFAFPVDSVRTFNQSIPFIENDKWGIWVWRKEETLFDEFRGVYPGRLRIRRGQEWSDIERGGAGPFIDTVYYHGYLEICDYLDNLTGNKNGHYVAKDIQRLIQNIDIRSIKYSQPQYDIIETMNIEGLAIHKISTDYLPQSSEVGNYTFMLDKPLIDILRERRTFELKIPEGMMFHPHYQDYILFYKICFGECNGELANLLSVFFLTHYNLTDIVFEQNGRKGVCDCFGHIVIDPEYDDATVVADKDLVPRGAIVSLSGRQAFALRSMPKPEPENWYDRLEYYGNDCFKVFHNGKLGLTDVFGNTVVPCEMDDISDLSDNIAVVKRNGKIGFIIDSLEFWNGYNGLIYSEPQYSEWNGPENLTVLKDGSWGYIDVNGNFTKEIEEQYDFWSEEEFDEDTSWDESDDDFWAEEDDDLMNL